MKDILDMSWLETAKRFEVEVDHNGTILLPKKLVKQIGTRVAVIYGFRNYITLFPAEPIEQIRDALRKFSTDNVSVVKLRALILESASMMTLGDDGSFTIPEEMLQNAEIVERAVVCFDKEHICIMKSYVGDR